MSKYIDVSESVFEVNNIRHGLVNLYGKVTFVIMAGPQAEKHTFHYVEKAF